MCDSEASTRPENWEPKMRGPRSFEGRDSPQMSEGSLVRNGVTQIPKFNANPDK